MFPKFPNKNSSPPSVDVRLFLAPVVPLNEYHEEAISGGITRLIEEFSPELATLQGGTAKQPEAEGKIRGTLILTF